MRNVGFLLWPTRSYWGPTRREPHFQVFKIPLMAVERMGWWGSEQMKGGWCTANTFSQSKRLSCLDQEHSGDGGVRNIEEKSQQEVGVGRMWGTQEGNILSKLRVSFDRWVRMPLPEKGSMAWGRGWSKGSSVLWVHEERRVRAVGRHSRPNHAWLPVSDSWRIILMYAAVPLFRD